MAVKFPTCLEPKKRHKSSVWVVRRPTRNVMKSDDYALSAGRSDFGFEPHEEQHVPEADWRLHLRLVRRQLWCAGRDANLPGVGPRSNRQETDPNKCEHSDATTNPSHQSLPCELRIADYAIGRLIFAASHTASSTSHKPGGM